MGVDKKSALGLLLTLTIVVFIAIYWITEPGRQSAAAERLQREAIVRGAERYLESCSSCHGQFGQGLIGPALRDTLLDKETLEKIVSRGVPDTPMPAWSEEEGGPLRDIQIEGLVTFIENWDNSLLGAAPPTTPPPATAGKQLFTNLECIVCHKINGEGGTIGPSLAGIMGSQRELTTEEQVVADEQYIKESIENPGAKVVKGYQAVMPESDLTDEQMNLLIEFLNSLK